MCEHCDRIEKAKKKEVPLKKDGTLKKKYKDMPRYKCILEYEKVLNLDYEDVLKNMLYDISEKAVKMLLK